MDIDKIQISDWQQFQTNNQTILQKADDFCTTVSDMIANTKAIPELISSANGKLANLKHVSVSQITEYDNIKTKVNNIQNSLQDKSFKIVVGVAYSEKVIDAYQKGEGIDLTLKSAASQLLNDVTDSNLCWIAYEYLRTSQSKFKGLGFLMAYGTDKVYEGGNFVWGDSSAAMAEYAIEGMFGININDMYVTKEALGNITWKHVTGTSVVMLYVATTEAKDLANKGDFTATDMKRVGYDTLVSGGGYLAWSSITASIEGIPGVGIASIVGVEIVTLANFGREIFIGDNVVHSYERTITDSNGKEYVKTYNVYKNGNGEDGTYDVILDNYRSEYKQYNLGNRNVSEAEYKANVYEDYDSVIYKNTGYHCNDTSGHPESWKKSSEALDELLRETAKIDDRTYAIQYFNDRITNGYKQYDYDMNKVNGTENFEEVAAGVGGPDKYTLNGTYATDAKLMYDILCDSGGSTSGFDIGEYWDYQHQSNVQKGVN